MKANRLPDAAHGGRVFDDGVARNYRAIVGNLAEHKFKISTPLLCCSHGFGIVLGATKRAARGFFQPCRAIGERVSEITIEGKNVLKILSPGFKRRYRFLLGEGSLLGCSWIHFVLLAE